MNEVKHIFLTGFMGSGKTTLGKKLADFLKIKFIDLDYYIEKKEKKTILRIFENNGESAFRKLETLYLKRLLTLSNPTVIALGGGTICFNKNLKSIKQNGILIYLKVPPKLIAERIINDKNKRPLLQKLEKTPLLKKIIKDIKSRKKYYNQAHIKINKLNVTPRQIDKKIRIFKKKFIINSIIFLFFLQFSSIAQELTYKNNNLGLNISANIALGSHFNRLGLTLNFFYLNDHFQTNSELRGYFNFKNLGPKNQYPEFVFSQGITYGYGDKQAFFNPFLNSSSNQTSYSNSFAYAYVGYFNKIKTQQQTGIIAIQISNFSILSENDIFAKPSLDRFRTGAFLIQYQVEDKYQFAINSSLWTGQMGKKQQINSTKINSGCYLDTCNGVFSEISHGLLSLQLKYHLSYSNLINAITSELITGNATNLQFNIGLDAEQIRNTIQNLIMHDAPFIPKKFRKQKNCHVPMIDANGHQFLFLDQQKIKPKHLYLNFFTNANIFY